jgi:HAE1 family hydrophobic/amphiphilic exporter-1
VVDRVTGQLDSVRERLETTGRQLDLTVITDQARYIRQAVREVLETAFYGGLLAVLVLFFFLRSVKKTLIISISIPVSVIATFFLMYVADISLNIMSLGGLTLGVGLLVDNAIVVLESVQRKRDQGLGEVEAARIGTSEVGRAITASTLTTICVFVPIVFVEGVAAQLFRDQALTVAFSLVVSLIVALTLIPMLASREFRPTEADLTADSKQYPAPLRFIGAAVFSVTTGLLGLVATVGRTVARVLSALVRPLLGVFDRALKATAAIYARAINGVLERPIVVVAVTIVLLVLSLGLFRTLGSELIPELVQGEFYADIELPPGTRLEVTDRQLVELAKAAREIEDARMVYSIAGTSNEQGGTAGELREYLGQITVTLDPPVSRDSEEAAMARIREAIDADNISLDGYREASSAGQRPAIVARFGRPSYFSFKTAIEIEIRGFNLALISRIADDVVSRMHSIDGLADINSSTEGGHPELQVHLNRDRLAAYDLGVADVAGVLRSMVQGDVATDIARSDRTIDIRIRAAEKFRGSARALENLTVTHVGNTAIPLSAVAEVRELEGPAEIRRADGSRIAHITANLAGRDLGSATDEIRAMLESMSWPSGYDWRLSGQEEEMATSFDSMRLAFALAVFMVYLVMASQFESLLHPFVILFSVPFAAIGVLVTMWLFGVTISVVSLIGSILLAGIVVNSAIVLVDYTNQLRRSGMAKNEALATAGGVRLRPILMTTATTVFGLLPMAVGIGEGAELRTPMALTVIGGLITSTLLTLLVVPAVYSILDRRQ